MKDLHIIAGLANSYDKAQELLKKADMLEFLEGLGVSKEDNGISKDVTGK